jgi:hypothetical protein
MRPVEESVAKREPLEALGLRHLSLQIQDRVYRLAEVPRDALEHRVVLGFHPAADRRVDRGDALRDDAPGPRRAGRMNEVPRPLRADAVGGLVCLRLARVEPPGKRGELMHQHLRPRFRDGGVEGAGVVDVADHDRRSRRLDLLPALGAAGHPRHVMAGRDQPAHERAANRAACTGDEDPHVPRGARAWSRSAASASQASSAAPRAMRTVSRTPRASLIPFSSMSNR